MADRKQQRFFNSRATRGSNQQTIGSNQMIFFVTCVLSSGADATDEGRRVERDQEIRAILRQPNHCQQHLTMDKHQAQSQRGQPYVSDKDSAAGRDL